MNSFFRELKQRRVYRVAIGYAIAAWLAIQIAAQPYCRHFMHQMLFSRFSLFFLGLVFRSRSCWHGHSTSRHQESKKHRKLVEWSVQKTDAMVGYSPRPVW